MLGYIVSTCATIEKVCCEIVAGLLGVADIKAEAVIYSLQASRARFEIMTKLTQKFAPVHIQETLLAELKVTQKLFKKRNELTHNLWITRHSQPHLHNIKRAPRPTRARSRLQRDDRAT